MIASVIDSRPAGFWIRALAALVDFVVFWLVNLSLTVIAGLVWRTELDNPFGIQGTIATCTFLFVALYTIVLHALEGQTIGKLVVGARVVGLDGAPPAIGASILRFFAYAASLFPLGLGFVMAGLRTDRRALHDLLAGTRVERLPKPARAVPAPPPPAPEAEETLAPPAP
jgi:uncharacterized RDD family membrane protein YckC